MKSLAVFALCALVGLGASVGLGLAGCNAAKGDHDGEVITPKPWGPPGGAAKFKPGARGAPSKPPEETEATKKS